MARPPNVCYKFGAHFAGCLVARASACAVLRFLFLKNAHAESRASKSRFAADFLAAGPYTLDQRKGQAGVLHAILNRGNIIRHAPEFNDAMIQIGDGERGARIAVARLADRAGIDQVARPRFQPQRGKAWAGFGPQLNDADLPRAIRKSALMVRV